MESEDRLARADRLTEVGRRAVLQGLQLAGPAVDQRHPGHRDLVEQRPDRVREAEARGWLEVPPCGEDRDRNRFARQLTARPGGEQVCLARRGADPEQRQQSALLELAGELELLRGDV